MSIFANYERPEGHEPGHIDLLVRENVAEDYGLPTVDFDNLSRMYTDELGLQAGKWTVKLFHGRWSGHANQPLSKLSLGYHVAGTNTIHSAVWSGGYHFFVGHGAERADVDDTDTMRKLIRQSVGVAEGRKQPLMLAKERAIAASPMLIAFGILNSLEAPEVLTLGLPAAIGAVSLKEGYWAIKSARREAKEAELHDKHQNDIVFPTSPYRTQR